MFIFVILIQEFCLRVQNAMATVNFALNQRYRWETCLFGLKKRGFSRFWK